VWSVELYFAVTVSTTKIKWELKFNFHLFWSSCV